MSLGNNIYELRSKANLSQEELAAKLGVSRQSVSKWETDASVPDVDKLIQLSKIFGVTLDFLVNGEDDFQQQAQTSIKETAEFENTSVAKSPQFRTRKIVGVVLMGVSLLSVLLSLIFMSEITPLIIFLSVYFLLCGIICVILKKSAIRLVLAIVALTVLYACIGIMIAGVSYMNPNAPIVEGFE